MVERRRWHWIGAGAVFAAVTAALNLPFALLCLKETGSLANWLAPYVFHIKRPLYWDTLLGVGQIWLGPLPWERYAGLWSLVLMLAAVAVRPRMSIEYKGVLICLAAVFFNRIYSTQFNLWFYPFLILGLLGDEPRHRRHIAITFLVLTCSTSRLPDQLRGSGPGDAEGSSWAARGGGRWTVVFSTDRAAHGGGEWLPAVLILRRREARVDSGRRGVRIQASPQTGEWMSKEDLIELQES